MASRSKEVEGHVPSNTLVPSLLTVLPVEIRLQIYEQVFHGSRVRVRTITPRTTWGKTLTLRPSHHHQILLVCRQIYTEALSTYWSSTVIDSALDVRFESTKFSEVIRVIPAFAQPVIKEIQTKGFTEKGRGLTFEQFIGRFARLETIMLEPDVIHLSRRRHRESDWSSETVIDLVKRGHPMQYPFSGLEDTNTVRFLQKVQFPVVVRSNGMRVRLGARHERYPAKVFFINHAKGLVAEGTIDTPDEVGFQQVL